MLIRADVIDLTRDSPRATDRFLVDTNVWFWVTYSEAPNLATGQQVPQYYDYLEAAYDGGAMLQASVLTFPELCHSIEHNEWRLYLKRQEPALTFKDFRREPRLHQGVVEAIRKTWYFVELTIGSDLLPVAFDHHDIRTLDADLDDLALDGYDLLMLHAMQTANMTQLLTDDADFGQVPDIQVFTANPYLIAQATQQGRLIARSTNGE